MTETRAKNLRLLRERHPQAARAVMAAAPASGKIIATDGLPNLELAGPNGPALLHPPTPEQDISFYLSQLPAEFPGTCVLLGMGLGHVPARLLAERPLLRHLVVLELDPGICRQALAASDLSTLLADPRLILHLGPDADLEEILAPTFLTIHIEDSKILRHLPSFALNLGYARLNQDVFDILNRLNVRGTTSRRFGRTFFANRLANMRFIRHHRLADDLENSFVGVPAIIVGGGPSLDKNIDQLAEAKGRALIIAVDSALPALLAKGVTPDFLVIHDTNDFAYEKIAGCAGQSLDICLICSGQTAARATKTFPARQIFWCLGKNELETWLRKSLGGDIIFPDSPTVANLALSAAQLMGASPVILIGMDLAYPGLKDHAAHTVLGNRDFINRLRDRENELIMIPGNTEEKIPTDRGLYQAKHFIEMFLRQNKNLFINATEGGAVIEGAVAMPLAEALARHAGGELDIGILREQLLNRPGAPATERFLAELEKTADELSDIAALIAKNAKLIAAARLAVAALPEAHAIDAALPPDIAAIFNAIEQTGGSIDSHSLIWTFLQDITLDGLKEAEHLKYQLLRGYQTGDISFRKTLELNLDRLLAINRFQKDAIGFFQENLAATIQTMRQDAGGDGQSLLQKAAFYLSQGNTVLAAPLVEQARAADPDSALACFQQGAIHLARRQVAEAEAFFTFALSRDHELLADIVAVRKKAGDDLLAAAMTRRETGREACRTLLCRGLSLCPDHEGLFAAIGQMLNEDAAEATAAGWDWEVIGDALAAAGQKEDALIAYANGLAARPGQRASLMRKISACRLDPATP